jgi:hypothetical protein
MSPEPSRCTYFRIFGHVPERCIIDGRETPPDGRVLCRTHRDEVIDARREKETNHERRMTRRASDARIASP